MSRYLLYILKLLILLSFFQANVVFASDVYGQKKQLKLANTEQFKSQALKSNILNTLFMDSDLRVEEFGTIASNSVLSLHVGENDKSFLLSGVTANVEEGVVVSHIVDPDGVIIYQVEINGDDITAISTLTDNLIGNNGEFSLFLPLFPHGDGELKVGTYQVTILSQQGNDISNVRVVYKQGSQGAQKVDYNVMVFERNPSLKGEEYLNNFFTNITTELNGLLNPHDISIGSINYKVANDQLTQEFAVISDGELIDVCQAVAQEFGVTRAVNLALVESLSFSDGDFAGLATGLPGIALDTNARLNCVLASQRAYGNNFHLHAANFLHEAGHFISFTHTTEEEGTLFDRFNDTPECDALTFDINNDNIVSDHECGFNGGADNFMFYSGDEDFTPFRVSEEQAAIMKAHPYFYPADAKEFNITPAMTGSWYNSEQSGHGFLIEILNDNRLLATWYVFDQNGNQAWLLGIGDYSGNEATLNVTLVENGVFPPLFDEMAVTRQPWGTMTFSFSGCNDANVSWQTEVDGFTSGNLSLSRLTSIASLSCSAAK